MATFNVLVAAAAAVFVAFASASDAFVEEAGETEIIPIDPDPPVAGGFVRAKRTPPLPDARGEEREDGSGGGGDDEDVGFGRRSDVFDDEDWGSLDPASVVPNRIVPTMLSPSFESTRSLDDEVFGPRRIAPTKTFRHPSGPGRSFEADAPEGSGNEEYDLAASTLVPSRPAVTYETRAAFDPSPVYPVGRRAGDGDRDLAIVTDRIADRKPYVQNRLKKYPVTAGKSIRIVIPEDTFNDPEDGNTRNLKLDLRHENGSVVRNSWLRFDPRKQAVYALPINENNIGRWTFVLKATDREGKSARDTLEIIVRQYKRSRLVNHQFEIEFSFTDWDPASTRDWQWMMLEKVQRLYGDRKPTHIIVRKAWESPFVFGWTNDTLTRQLCPKGDIEKLFGSLVESGGGAVASGRPSPALKTLLARSKISVTSVKMTFLGTCLADVPRTPIHPDLDADNQQPVIRNPIDRLNVTAGELLRFKVPEDTCYDNEDGGTERLKLELLTPNRRELPPDSWIQFDSKNQQFVGVPLEEEVGTTEYQFVCSDRKGLIALDGIEVVVNNRPFNERFEMEVSLVFADDAGFRASKVRVVEIIAEHFGDATPSNVVLKTFDADEGTVVFVNKTHANLGCKDDRLKWMRDMLLEADGKVKRDLVERFQPYLDLRDVRAIKRGRCATGSLPKPTDPADRKPGGSLFNGLLPSADYLLTFIIPAVIITCMLILAILLACVLHKKRKAGKLNLFYSESLPPRVPVILQDELYDDGDPSSYGRGQFKQPVLLPDDTYRDGGNSRMPVPRDPNEMDRLLSRPAVSIDPFSKGSLSRPTPTYR